MAPKAFFGSSVGFSSVLSPAGAAVVAPVAAAAGCGALAGAVDPVATSVVPTTAWDGRTGGWPVSRRSWFSISCNCWLSTNDTLSTAPGGTAAASTGTWAGWATSGIWPVWPAGAAEAVWPVAGACAAGAAGRASAGSTLSRCWTTALGVGRSVISCRKLTGALKWRLICRASWVSSSESSPRSTKGLSRSASPMVMPQTSSMVSASSWCSLAWRSLVLMVWEAVRLIGLKGRRMPSEPTVHPVS